MPRKPEVPEQYSHLLELVGKQVTAKRRGYKGDYNGTPEQDLEPLEYSDWSLQGKFEILNVRGGNGVQPHVQYLVNGHSADPDTVTLDG